MYRVIRRAMLQEDEGHDQEYGEFETKEAAQSWIDNIGTTDGYFSASSFYIQDTFNFVPYAVCWLDITSTQSEYEVQIEGLDGTGQQRYRWRGTKRYGVGEWTYGEPPVVAEPPK